MRRITGTDAWRICKINFHLAVRNNFFLAAAYLLTIPLLRGIANLDRIRSAECLKQSVALIGVFLIVPLSAPEQSKAIREIVSARKVSYRRILLLRLLLSLLSLLLLISLFAGIMIWNNCTFPFALYVAETVAGAAVSGGVGLAAAVLGRSVIVGCLVSAGYFLLNLM